MKMPFVWNNATEETLLLPARNAYHSVFWANKYDEVENNGTLL